VVAAGRADGDVARADGARAQVERALDRLGGGLDLLVCAAADGFAPKPVADVTEADWDAAVDTLAKGTFFLAQAAANALREARGVIVVIEDVASYQPWPSFAPHCAAKAAQAMLTRVLARALAVVYLAGAEFVTGTSIVVDGGRLLQTERRPAS
jgi:pteridine reductase